MQRVIQLPWFALRTAVVADDTALTTFDYDSWPASGGITIRADTEQSQLQDARRWYVAFHGAGADNATAGYKLLARRTMNGPIILLAQGIITRGTQAVTNDPITKAASSNYWCDTITITAGLWNDIAPLVLDSGANRIAYLKGRNEAVRDLYLEIDLNADLGGSYLTEVNAIVTGTDEA